MLKNGFQKQTGIEENLLFDNRVINQASEHLFCLTVMENKHIN